MRMRGEQDGKAFVKEGGTSSLAEGGCRREGLKPRSKESRWDHLSFLERPPPAAVTACVGRCAARGLSRSGYSNKYLPNQEVNRVSDGNPRRWGRNAVTSPSLVHWLHG